MEFHLLSDPENVATFPSSLHRFRRRVPVVVERVFAEPKRKIRIYLGSGWPADNYEPTRSMRDRLIWKEAVPDRNCFIWRFLKRNTTRTRGPPAARFPSSSFSENCRPSEKPISGVENPNRAR